MINHFDFSESTFYMDGTCGKYVLDSLSLVMIHMSIIQCLNKYIYAHRPLILKHFLFPFSLSLSLSPSLPLALSLSLSLSLSLHLTESCGHVTMEMIKSNWNCVALSQICQLQPDRPSNDMFRHTLSMHMLCLYCVDKRFSHGYHFSFLYILHFFSFFFFTFVSDLRCDRYLCLAKTWRILKLWLLV